VLSGDCSLIRGRFGLDPQYAIERTLGDLLDYWRRMTSEGAGH
jgi:hypothetical protein